MPTVALAWYPVPTTHYPQPTTRYLHVPQQGFGLATPWKAHLALVSFLGGAWRGP